MGNLNGEFSVAKLTGVTIIIKYSFNSPSFVLFQEAFRAFHNDPKFVRKYLKALHIGSLPESEYKQDDIKKDFEELREKVTKLASV